MSHRSIPAVPPAALLVAALALGACGTHTATDDTTGAAPQPAETQVVAVPPPERIEPSAPPPPPELIGLGHDRVVGLLGEPVFQRRDAPALLMRYRAEGCILDLFLYPAAVAEAAAIVEHVEARTPEGRSTAPGACISSVMKPAAG